MAISKGKKNYITWKINKTMRVYVLPLKKINFVATCSFSAINVGGFLLVCRVLQLKIK